MKFQLIKANELEKPVRLSIHKSGKMGFPIEAAKKMKLDVTKSIGIGTDANNEADKSLYMVVYDDVRDEAYKVSKAGEYFYLNTKLLFDSLKIDYIGKNIWFQMETIKDEDDTYYKLTKKEADRKAGDDEEEL